MKTEMKEYNFTINDFKPETMPFGRLVEYYSEIKKMLGVGSGIQLVKIFDGSHASAFRVDQGAERDLAARVRGINERNCPKQAIRAFDTLNQMLREDNTSGSFSDADNQNVIRFPGCSQESDVLYTIKDSATFTGELYYIAGATNGVNVRINTDSYGVVFCKTSRDIGKALRDFLFDNVRVTGRGTWKRLRDGKWEIEDFSITDYTPVFTDGLRSAVDRIREKDIDWPEDPIAVINEIEERNPQVH